VIILCHSDYDLILKKYIQDLIKNASSNSDEMLLNGKAPLPGQVVQLPTLAQTLREVADHGKDGFYRGRVAEAIVELIQSKGGLMDLDDLANHSTSFVEPIKYTYANEVTVYEVSILVLPRALFSTRLLSI